MFLPPDSPDLNPIEQVFAKLKTRLRKHAPAPSEPWPKASSKASRASSRTSATTISSTPDMLPLEMNGL